MVSTLSSHPSSKSTNLNGIQRLLEAGLLISCAFSMYIMLALFTFNRADPGWSQTGYYASIRNMGGMVGAYLSDLLLSFFGVIAYSLPFVIAVLGWLVFQKYHMLRQLDFLTLGLKILGFIMMYIGITSLASMNVDDIFHFPAGGIIGDVLSHSVIPYLSMVGSTLLFVLLCGSGFVLLTGVSLLNCVDLIGEYVIKAVDVLVRYFNHLKAKYLARIEEKNATQAFQNNDYKVSNTLEEESEILIGENVNAQVFDEQAEEHNEESKNVFQKLFSNNEKSEESSSLTTETGSTLNETKSSKPVINESAKALKVDDEPEVKAAFEKIILPEDSDSADTHILNKPFTINETEADLSLDNALEPYVDIDELIGEPLAINVQEHVSEDEIHAAFENVDVINVSEQPSNMPQAMLKPNETDKEAGLPSIELLDRPDKAENPITMEELKQVGHLVEEKLLEYGVKAQVVGVYPGPVITRFEVDLAPGIKASKISGLSTDLARSLSAKAVRVVEVIEGKSFIGIELPNKYRETVFFSSVLANDKFAKSSSKLTMAIGSDISGEPVITDLAKMPHLLVAGTTGSGKSVAINTMIVSILYKSAPEDVRMIMIDPKQVELSVYDGIPHLLSEVVTDMKEAANALRWCVGEMERRYQLMSKLGVRNLKGYNAKVTAAIDAGEPMIDPLWQPTDAFSQTPPTLEKLPAIVIIVDEFADMMMIVGKKVEELIARIAQKARAAGIHLILATQRPSADVITGLIKANIPTRIALRVQSRIESRIILDQQGAEQLLGMGDMFYLAPGEAIPVRVHGAFVNDDEVHAVVNDWKSRAEPDYIEDILSGGADQDILLPGEQSEESSDELDTLYDEALTFVTETRRVSISSVQRKFRIGYNRAARIVEQMEMQGVVSTPGTNGAREVLAPPPVKA